MSFWIGMLGVVTEHELDYYVSPKQEKHGEFHSDPIARVPAIRVAFYLANLMVF